MVAKSPAAGYEAVLRDRRTGWRSKKCAKAWSGAANIYSWIIYSFVRDAQQCMILLKTRTNRQRRVPMIATLKARLGEKVSDDPAILESHGKDASYPRMIPPLAVVYAGSLEDVQETLAWCRENHIPLIPYGSGSSLEGQIIPHVPAITLDFSRMKRVLEIRAEDFLAVVEPGITREELEKELQDTGLFFPVDPGANASLGGMAATNASGTTTVRYGGMRQNVAELEVVLANGQVLQLGRPVRKTSSGYDLKDLFIGSGGTLGVITRLTLNLHPVPEHIHALRLVFPGVVEAAEAAYAIMASALPVARLELIDSLSMRAINQIG